MKSGTEGLPKQMASEKQIAANRRNALLSTGPKTQEGKAAVRLNALRHGLRARSVLLPGEKPEEYSRLCNDLETDWQPRNRTEQLLVEQMAVAQWKLARMEVSERSIFEKEMPADKQLALLDRFSVQRGRLERSFSRAVREIEHLQKSRAVHEEQAGPVVREIPAAAEPARQFTYIMAGHGADESPAIQPSMLMSSPAQPDSR